MNELAVGRVVVVYLNKRSVFKVIVMKIDIPKVLLNVVFGVPVLCALSKKINRHKHANTIT